MTSLDWGVIAAYVALLLGVGGYYARRAKTQDDFLLGGRAMNPWAVGLSYFATMFSTLTYLGVPGELVRHGPMILAQLLGLPVVYLLVGRYVIPLVMRQPVTTAHELLETRLGVGVRTLAAAFFLTMRLLWMALVIHATAAIVLVPVLGLSPAAAPWVGLVMAAITVVYTALGGFRAVVATDVLQTAILFGGALAAIGIVTADFGGLGWVPDRWQSHWQPPSLGLDPTVRVGLVNAVLAVAVWHACTAGSDQMAVQRYLSTRDARTARQMLLTGLACVAGVTLTLAVVGAAVLAYAQAHPDLLGGEAAILANPDGLFPRFISQALPSGLRGLVVGGLLAAAMSSLSSGLSAVTSVVAVDFVERLGGRKAAEFYGTAAARILPWGVGAAVVGLSLVVAQAQGNVLELCNKVVNLLVAPLAGIFFLAMFVPRATPTAAWAGAAAGLAVGVVVGYWRELTGTDGIAFFWMMPLSLAASLVTGWLAAVAAPAAGRQAPHDNS